MLLAEQRERAEYARLVDGFYPVLQFRQRHGSPCALESTQHDEAVGCGLHAVLFQQCVMIVLIHNCLQSYNFSVIIALFCQKICKFAYKFDYTLSKI